MKVIADICIVPVGVGVSLSAYVAACERILIDADNDTQMEQMLKETGTRSSALSRHATRNCIRWAYREYQRSFTSGPEQTVTSQWPTKF